MGMRCERAKRGEEMSQSISQPRPRTTGATTAAELTTGTGAAATLATACIPAAAAGGGGDTTLPQSHPVPAGTAIGVATGATTGTTG